MIHMEPAAQVEGGVPGMGVLIDNRSRRARAGAARKRAAPSPWLSVGGKKAKRTPPNSYSDVPKFAFFNPAQRRCIFANGGESPQNRGKSPQNRGKFPQNRGEFPQNRGESPQRRWSSSAADGSTDGSDANRDARHLPISASSINRNQSRTVEQFRGMCRGISCFIAKTTETGGPLAAASYMRTTPPLLDYTPHLQVRVRNWQNLKAHVRRPAKSLVFKDVQGTSGGAAAVFRRFS